MVTSRSFNGTLNTSGRTVSDRLWGFVLDNPEPFTAWEAANAIDALGSTVSSMLFKLRKRGILVHEVSPRTTHRGRTYQRRHGSCCSQR